MEVDEGMPPLSLGSVDVMALGSSPLLADFVRCSVAMSNPPARPFHLPSISSRRFFSFSACWIPIQKNMITRHGTTTGPLPTHLRPSQLTFSEFGLLFRFLALTLFRFPVFFDTRRRVGGDR